MGNTPEHKHDSEIQHPSRGDLLRLETTPDLLSQEVRAQIETHLSTCPECTTTRHSVTKWVEEDKKTTEQIEAMDWNQLVTACNEALAQDDASILVPIAERCGRALKQDRNNTAALDILLIIAEKGPEGPRIHAQNWLMRNGITTVQKLE